MKKFSKILNDDTINDLKNLLTSPAFPWRFNSCVSNIDDPSDLFYFTGSCYNYNQIQDLRTYELLFPLIHFLEEKIQQKPLLLWRIKINAYPRTHVLQEHTPHKDYDKKGLKAFVYMVNSNDGYTRIGSNKVKSIENTGVLFESSQIHNSTTCTNEKLRLTINVNYW